jgi:hypothetical protein
MSGPVRIEALLLGSLGILTDLRDQERRAFNQAFAEHGAATAWSPADYDAILARHGRYRGIEAELGALALPDRAAFLHRVEEAFRDILDATIPVARPWTSNLLAQARGWRSSPGRSGQRPCGCWPRCSAPGPRSSST